MKDSMKSFIFMIVLGVLTAGLITGVDALTKNRILRNSNYEWKSAMLNHHGVSSTVENHASIFDENFSVEVEASTPREVVYKHKTEGTYSYFFTGSGLWGEINGVITLESDLKTIVKITVLNQQETPGLGGLVSTRKYLNNYVGKKFDPSLALSDPDLSLDKAVQVDQITGATGTSRRFILLLNDNYEIKMGGLL